MTSERTQEADPNTVLARLCQPILEANGFELVEAAWQMNRRQPLVRLYVHKPGGVTIGECQKILRMLDPMLRVEGILDDRTLFEVASPGLDRPLHTAADFRRAEGHFVVVRRRLSDHPPAEERLIGKVTYADTDGVVLLLDSGETVAVPLEEVIQGKFDIRF